MTESMTGDDRRARVLRLLQFLHELIRARSTIVRNVDDHEEIVWLGDEWQIPVRTKAVPGERFMELRAEDKPDVFSLVARMIDGLAERPESLELVLADGLLGVSAGADGVAVNQHLLTQAVVAEHDHVAGVITIALAGDSVPDLQDSHLLTGLDGFDLNASAEVADAVSALPSVLASGMDEVLQRWRAEVPIDSAAVTLESKPALILRNRGSGPMLDYYETMLTALRDPEVDVPIGLAQLVEPIEAPERIERLAATGAMSAAELVEDALYPLPSNVEQRDILAQLGLDSGVVVEGPPGTGKTHTIANLMSALLAKGQRVLVVSEKAQALQVLRDKLPPELRELAVAITDVTKDGSASLIESVEAIAARKGTFQPRVVTSEIKNLRSKRDQARAKREQILREIWQLRESETEKHEWVAAGYSGTAAAIVRSCQAVADRYDWLPGPLESPLPPLDTDDMDRLLQLLRTRDDTWAARLGQRLPDLDAILPDSVTIDAICARIREQPVEKMTGSGSLLAILADVDSARLLTIKSTCEQLRAAVTEVRSFPDHLQEMAGRLLSGEAAYLWNRVTQISAVVDEATRRDREIGTHDVVVDGVPAAGAASVFDDAAQFLRSGGSWKSRFRKSPQQRAVEALGLSVTVDGRAPGGDATAMQLVADHLAVLQAVGTVQSILADVGVPVDDTGSRSAQLGQLVLLDARLGWVSELLVGRDSLVRTLESISPGGPRPKSIDEVAHVAEQTAAIAATNDAVLARRELDECARVLSAEVDQGPSAEGDALLAAIAAADADAIREARRAWNTARAQRDQQGALDLLELRLRQKAPQLHKLLRADAADPVWDVRLRELTDAWSWRRAYDWARDRSDPGREARLEADLDAVEADIAHFTAGLAAACAWRECLEQMTVAQVQALQSYRDHITNLGKGSGKHAERFRRAARSAMSQAQGAVPAWIMPISQVLSSIAPDQNSFDVVIVDEASQADITSLFLLWLAPRVIVVGDDRQCAPGGFAGNGLDEVFAKLDTYLSDVPQYMRDSLTPRSSLFSMLRTRFGHVVRLREHFRSMPEIIEYSSRQFYPDSPLVPVRQFGADRLPPLRTVFVSDAVAEGSNAGLTNQAEADALVQAVVTCAADPAYAGLSFGVVVLQGQRQVDLIAQKLRAALPAAQWYDRSLRIGTPPDFQGDERHVVFLSMVVSADRNPVSLTRSESQRRFNVAASRAMEQLWLFHSVGSDALKDNDLRYSLLSYMERTEGALVDPMPDEVSATERVEPFESLFEQQIFLELVARGFHVNPKVSVNNRVIDLVVTGADARLAVECDGDEFTSTPEQARADMERERELRRCGWRFWRVRESEYLLDPKRALEGVWRELEARGVAPGSVDESVAAVSREPWEPIDLTGGD
ncbi:AAA domain-containing protein [Williamsia sp. CHRR-6]|uniref:AAA domain-containing protein n=1 Tax=Williamsia sp. CHRR-6 TaxID=2835871 RepID=UPI001BDAB04B|nr:AAA domain-containing protein [Williamsia sp. CHRR-6]MBT0568266.1 AAA family ATPase [Williamsia sp. CHRR-6]